MNKKLRLLVSVALLAWLAWRTDWNQVRDAFGRLRLELWLAAIGIFLLAQVASAVRWRLLAQPLGFPNPLRQFVRFYFVGMFFNLPTSCRATVIHCFTIACRRLLSFTSSKAMSGRTLFKLRIISSSAF